nr:hypothetical protein [uncultured Desulfobacter sp.]
MTDALDNWQAIIELGMVLKRCDDCGISTASVAMAFICIDTVANLNRPLDKIQVTRSDFIEWVDTYLDCHPKQKYKYRGKDVYAARCAFLHTYGSEAQLHTKDPDIVKFTYHDGGKHAYDPNIDKTLVAIGIKSFVNDVLIAVKNFLEKCEQDLSLKKRVEKRLCNVLKTLPLPLK